MINRGRRDNLYLYEITDQDLVLTTFASDNYAAGNILIFSDKKDISLGAELAKADDFSAATEYLQNAEDLVSNHLKELEDTISTQQQQIKQRDNLLSELSEDLDSQKYSNQVLIAQLDQVRNQIEIERLSKEEAVDDLQQVSAETHSLDAELARAIDAKLNLEQELAASITDLLELNLQNDELKRSLETKEDKQTSLLSEPEPMPQPESEMQPQAQPQITMLRDTYPHTQVTNPEIAYPVQSTVAPQAADAGGVLTMSSGKQIHIYHDFPTPPKQHGVWLFGSGSNLARMIMMLVLALALAVSASIVATANVNDISFGESLDLLLKSFSD